MVPKVHYRDYTWLIIPRRESELIMLHLKHNAVTWQFITLNYFNLICLN